jgi:hypothetical protein
MAIVAVYRRIAAPGRFALPMLPVMAAACNA